MFDSRELGRDLAELLRGDHVRLNEMITDVLNAAETGDRATVQKAWDRFEPALSNHLNWEEREMIPTFAVSQPDRAREILADHEKFRKAITEIGMGIDLRSVRADDVRALMGQLRSHAITEDASLYAWLESDHRPDGSRLQQLLERFREALARRKERARERNGGVGTRP